MWYDRASVYQKRFEDAAGIFFTEEEFPQIKENRDDVAPVLQQAIERLLKEQSYGIIYIPEGEYRMKRTVLIPPSVRLIGYGKKRPVFVLPAGTDGYQGEAWEETNDPMMRFLGGYPGANYMFWFIGDKGIYEKDPKDANAATFYSAMSNIDFFIEENNAGAVCIRAHFAQHGFISHCHFELGDGLAGIFDVGNEMEDLTFCGGTYGIVCRMCSPGWPFALLDSVFEGQKKAAVLSAMTGFSGFRLKISNTPKAFDLYFEDAWEKLYLEDCIFENIGAEAITTYQTENIIQQTNLKNIHCKNVPVLIKKADVDSFVRSSDEIYTVSEYACGYMMDETKDAAYQEILKTQPLDELPKLPASDIPPVPPMEQWVSVTKYGAKGDGVTDDTKAIQKALDESSVLYFPQGIYKIKDTIYLRKDSCILGMSPITTQIVIEDDEEAFAGFGAPKPLIETARGGYAYISGIGVDTAGKNPRAAGIKWMAGETSYMNDVKFVGGHGLMFRDGRNAYAYLYNAGRTADYDPDRVWDYQYASLWITENGGGVFKDLWSASPYAETGIAVTNTTTKGRMYAISLEHHVRNEIKLHGVSNWSFYALQTEEEKAEGLECLPMEIVSCKNISFANYFLFRVVAVDRSYETGIQVFDSRGIRFFNLHNKAQMQYVFTLTLEDKTTGFYAKSPEYARLVLDGEKKTKENKTEDGYEILAEGFDFAQGAVLDADHNLYWCDKVHKRIYKYDVRKGCALPFFDIHFMPSALAVDKAGNLLVAADYSELKKTVPGQPFQSHDMTNFHPFFSWFYKRSEKVYAVSLKEPFDTMRELEKVPAKMFQPQIVYRPAQMDYPGMFSMIAEKEITHYYMAPDGKTALEATIDLARSLLLRPAVPGAEFVLTDDAGRGVYSYKVTDKGSLTQGEKVTHRGQYGAVRDTDGMIWAMEDKLYGFSQGKVEKIKAVPKDACTMLFDGDILYVIGRHKIYRTKM